MVFHALICTFAPHYGRESNNVYGQQEQVVLDDSRRRRRLQRPYKYGNAGRPAYSGSTQPGAFPRCGITHPDWTRVEHDAHSQSGKKRNHRRSHLSKRPRGGRTHTCRPLRPRRLCQGTEDTDAAQRQHYSHRAGTGTHATAGTDQVQTLSDGPRDECSRE